MGVRVMFFHGSADGLFSHFLNGPLHEFRAWYEESLEEFPEEVNLACVALLEDVLREGRHALEEASRANPELVDLLLTDYYGLFADFKSKLQDATQSCLSIRHYQALENRLTQNGMDEEAVLLSYLSSGRPVLRDALERPFYSEDEVFRLVYWTAEEVEKFKTFLELLDESELRRLDPDWGALPSVQEATDAAFARRSGLIITVA